MLEARVNLVSRPHSRFMLDQWPCSPCNTLYFSGYRRIGKGQVVFSIHRNPCSGIVISWRLLLLGFEFPRRQHFFNRQLHIPYLGTERGAAQPEDFGGPGLLSVGLSEGARYQ
jgi:hypothetical protein